MNKKRIVLGLIVIGIILISCSSAMLLTTNVSLKDIEQDIQTHFETVNTTDLNCYGMSEAAKEYLEDEYGFPIVYVHGETTRRLKSLKHTWLMMKIGGSWHEFESTRLEFIDVSDTFELQSMTYDYRR